MQSYHLLAALAAGANAAGDQGDLHGYELLVDLVVALLAAFIGGVIAHRLKLPVITGYLLAGVCIGPFTPGPVAGVERVQTMAELGVALLMFALGTQFSLNELAHVGRGAIGGGVLQVVLTIGLGVPLGLALGFPVGEAIYLGGLVAISSSIVILKLLLSRSEVESLHGRLALGVGVVQDISVVVLVVVLPALAASGQQGEGIGSLLSTVGFALLKAVIFLGSAYLLGTRLIPPLLYRIIRLGMRELFLLVILTVAVGTALLAQVIGLSFALGAFLAGMIVSESDAADDVLNEIIPIRDVFATLFFVSIGLLINPAFIWEHLGEVILLVAGIIIGKFAIAAFLFWIFRYPIQTALKSGLLLAQIGEFSFVLARTGVVKGAITPRLENLTLASALVTIILTPVLFQVVPTFLTRLEPWLANLKPKPKSGLEVAEVATQEVPEKVIYDWPGRDPRLDALLKPESISRDLRTPIQRWPYKKHVIICGFGRIGHELLDAVRRRNFDVAIIEYDLRRAAEAQERGIVVFTGDATAEYVLKQANITQARVLAITTPDLSTAEAITRIGRKLNPELEIITRSSDARAIRALREAGAGAVVQPEIEAGLEFIRRTLRAYGVSGVELQGLINGRRELHYGK
ncbi:MAG TPA: cation:proton antiporter [Chloroflexia bacterium]|nr:cation:proton antiporter [Chloroflexia bacterium]